MLIKTLGERVGDAFPGAQPGDFGEDYLSLLISRWGETQVLVRRTSIAMVAFATAFVLLGAAHGDTQVKFGEFELTGSAAVLMALPAGMSFLCVDLCCLQAETVRCRILCTEVCKLLYPDFYRNGLHLTLRPSSLPVWGTNPRQALRSVGPKRISRALEVANLFFGGLVIAGPVAFLVFAYWWLFDQVPADDLLVGISCAIAVFNGARALLVVGDEVTSGAWVELRQTRSISRVE